MTFYTRPLWMPGTALPALAASLDALDAAHPVAADPLDDPDRWYSPPVSVTGSEIGAFCAWRAMSLCHGPEALRLWREVFPAPVTGPDPLAELVARESARWAGGATCSPPT